MAATSLRHVATAYLRVGPFAQGRPWSVPTSKKSPGGTICHRAAGRQFHKAAAEMTASAMALADSIITQAPDRHVSADELAKVESFVIDVVLKEAHAELQNAGASPLAHAMGDTVVLDEFKRIFTERFREQAPLMLARHGGHA